MGAHMQASERMWCSPKWGSKSGSQAPSWLLHGRVHVAYFFWLTYKPSVKSVMVLPCFPSEHIRRPMKELPYFFVVLQITENHHSSSKKCNGSVIMQQHDNSVASSWKFAPTQFMRKDCSSQVVWLFVFQMVWTLIVLEIRFLFVVFYIISLTPKINS
jgi:hypothetical protein